MLTDYRRLLLIGNVVSVTALYVFNQYYCSEGCYVFFEKPYLGPLLIGLVGLFASSVLINFFSSSIMISWLKNIALWFIPLTFILVASVEEGQGLFPLTSDGRSDTAVLMMAILFVVTLVYAVIMNKRLKNGQ